MVVKKHVSAQIRKKLFILFLSQLLRFNNAEDFFLTHDQKLFAVDLDFGAGVLAEQDLVASFDIEREDFAFVVRFAFARADTTSPSCGFSVAASGM